MRIAIGCDHGGIVLKEACIRAVKLLGHEVIDFGTYDERSVDYPDFAEKVARAIIDNDADKGILLCGTGIGISIAANKIKGIRCAHITDEFCAQMCAEHNNANIIAMGGRITSPVDAEKMVIRFLTSRFAEGRHQTRLDKISKLEG